MKRSAILVVALTLSGCVNPYSKFYQDRTGGMDVTKAPNVVLYDGEPKLYTGQNPDEDRQRMMENGYILVGISSFNGRNINFKKAKSQARDVHAEVVFCYSKYSGTNSGVMPVTVPNNQTSTTTMTGNAYGSGGSANFNGTATTNSYGTQTTFVPYNVRRYEYFASYWVKSKTPIFGVRVTDPTDEQRKESGGNKGLAVIVVIKGSPAFRSDFFKGDMLKKIGDIDMYDVKDFNAALDKYQGQNVKVQLVRDGKELVKDVQFNQKPE